MENKSNGIGSRLNSFAYALKGLNRLVKYEPNARIHLAATVLVIIAGFGLGFSKVDWLAITIAIGIVWIAEGFNTCIELLCDACLGTKYDKRVEVIKDISAAAVLVASLVSLAIGLIVFFL